MGGNISNQSLETIYFDLRDLAYYKPSLFKLFGKREDNYIIDIDLLKIILDVDFRYGNYYNLGIFYRKEDFPKLNVREFISLKNLPISRIIEVNDFTELVAITAFEPLLFTNQRDLQLELGFRQFYLWEHYREVILNGYRKSTD